MVRVIQPVKVITKDGEATVHIKLELNVNVNAGQLAVAAQVLNEDRDKEDKTQWVIPEFKPTNQIEFGRTVEE